MPFRVGDNFGAIWCFSEQQVADFATMARDFNPIHHDRDVAAATRFGRIVLSGTHYTAMMMGLVATYVSERSPTLGLAFDFKFKKAVFAEETLTVNWVIDNIHWHDKLGGYLIHFTGHMVNEADEVCTTATAILLSVDAL